MRRREMNRQLAASTDAVKQALAFCVLLSCVTRCAHSPCWLQLYEKDQGAGE